MIPRSKIHKRLITAWAACCAGLSVLTIGCAIPGQLAKNGNEGELKPIQNQSRRQSASSNLAVPADRSQQADQPIERTVQQVGYAQPTQNGSGFQSGPGLQNSSGFPQQAGDFQQASGYVYQAGYQQPNPRVYANPQGPISPADAMAADRMQHEMHRQELMRQQSLRQNAMQQSSMGNSAQLYHPTADPAVAPVLPATNGYQPGHFRDSNFSSVDLVSPPSPISNASQQARSNQYGGFSMPNRPYQNFDPTESHRTHNGFLEFGPTLSGGTLNPFPRTATDHALELKAQNDRLREAGVRKNQELADKNKSLERAQALINERDQQLADSRIRGNELEKQISRLSTQLKVAELEKANLKQRSDATLKSIESTLDAVLLQSISQN